MTPGTLGPLDADSGIAASLSADSTPEVTVAIPVYNGGRTIGAALQSVFEQTYTNYEVIVVDDGSTDDTAVQVTKWADRVRYQRQQNSGPASARNVALRSARGRYVAFLDADDIWLPAKLERQIAYFARFPQTGLLHTGAVVSSAPTHAALDAIGAAPGDDADTPPRLAYGDLFHGWLDISTLTVMAPRDVLLELHVEDWDLWLRVAARFPLGFIAAQLAIHRPGGSMSSAVEKTYRGQQLVIRKAAALCGNACDVHAGAPEECVRSREFRLYSELGYERFWSGRTVEARAAFTRALQLNPGAMRSRMYHAATFVGPRWVRSLRILRDACRRGKAPAAPDVDNLINATAFRRARSTAVRALHRVDAAVSGLGRPKYRVLFEAASPLSLVVAKSLLDALRRDDRLELWFTANDGGWDVGATFGPAGPSNRLVSASRARWMKFDAYINTDFWNMTWLPRRTRRVHLFHGVAGKYGLDAPTRIAPVVATFDRLMFPNHDRLMRYAEAGLVDPDSPTAALIGYPKVDCLVDGSLNRVEILDHLGLDRSKPTVLYAPTWSPHSSLASSGESIITSLAALGINVIVKLHDRSYDRSLRASGGIDWRTRITSLCDRYGVHFTTDMDISPYLYAADVLVTDHSSVGFEFMLLDRPIVVVDCPDLIAKARVSSGKVASLRSASEVVSADGVASAVSRSLRDPLRLSGERRQIAAEMFYRPGTAGTRAIRCVYSLLDLCTPDVLPIEARPQPAPATTPALLRDYRRTTNHV
jgi:glycosyltransferase involved in cell wall biosynthesis